MIRLAPARLRSRWARLGWGLFATGVAYAFVSGLYNEPTDTPRPHGLIALLTTAPLLVAVSCVAAAASRFTSALLCVAASVAALLLLPLSALSLGVMAVFVLSAEALLGPLAWSSAVVLMLWGLVSLALSGWSDLRAHTRLARVLSLAGATASLFLYAVVAKSLWPTLAIRLGGLPLP